MNPKLKRRTSAFSFAQPAAALMLALASVMLGLSIGNAASLSVPTYTLASDSPTPPNYDLSVTGTQDWQVYEGGFTSPTHKQYGNSITLTTPVTVVSPCVTEILGSAAIRSSATFNWTLGTPTASATGYNPNDAGFKFSVSNSVGYGVNYETYTFVPGDTNRHTVHLYGYCGNAALLRLQFSNSLAGAASTTTNPPTALGDFDYSVQFQADQPTNALTVLFTFSKTSNSSQIATAGINATAMDGPPPVTPVNWRVIADDTNFPTSDTVLAGVVAGDVIYGTNSLPADTTNNDCSAYFQAAMNFMSQNGGGTVFVPPGHYKFTNGLTLPDGVILRGRWVQPGPGQPVTNCTIFDVYFNSNVPPAYESADTNTFITGLGFDSGLRDLTFWYPNQNPTNPVPYPYTICNLANMKTIENVTLVNSYAGVDMDQSSFACLRGIYGTTLEMGVRMDNGQAVPRVDTLNLAPDYWSWSGLPGAPTNATTKAALANLMLNNTNCIGLEAENVDCYFVQNITISGYCYGVRLTKNGDNPGQPEFYNVVATNCTEALRLDSTKSLQAINCTFGGTTNGYGVHRIGQAAGDYTGCTIYGGAGAILCDPSGTYFHLNLEGCTLSNSVTMNSHYQLVLAGSRFLSTGTNVVLNTGAGSPQQAVIAGNTNCGPANVALNLGSGDQVVINTNPVAPVTVPNFPMDYPRTRKAGKTNLFNVLTFGAKGDGVTNDTAAVQAALAAANTNQGGIVFFPPGTYLLTQSLSVSNGVELRGIFGGRHENANSANRFGSGMTGSQLNLSPATTNGPAFITLYGQSGMRGLNLNYPNQNANSQIPYPYMIQCSGGSNYLVDLCGSAYQGVDLNGAKAALVDYCFFGALQNMFIVRGGSTDCRIQNVHAKPGSWWDSGKGPSDSIICAQENTFIVQDCTNLTINSIFNHAAHTMFTQRGGTGQVLLLNGEKLQRAYVMETAPANGVFNFMGCNALVYQVGDGTGNFGWWLQTNYVGTVTATLCYNAVIWANYVFRVDNTNACLILNDPAITFQTSLMPTIRAAGKVVINNASLNYDFTVDVPALGNLYISNSILSDMPYAPQPGYQNWSNNCIIVGGSFIAANLGDNPVVTNGISLNTNNLGNEPVDLGYAWHLLNGSTNFLLDVTSPAFTNGLQPNVTIQIAYYENSDGHLSVWYDSTSGKKLGATYLLSSTNSQWDTQSLSVSDARFSGTNDIILTVDSTNCDPIVRLVRVDTASYLGVPLQLSSSPPPVASFTATPTNGIRPLAVTFTDTSSGSITNLLWNFGDGQTTNTLAGVVVTHNYQTNGTYTVSLKASGPGGGNTNTQLNSVTVLIPNPPQITSIQPMGKSALVLQGTGGPTNGGYYYWMRSSTNLMLPLTNWSIVATNPFDAYGNFSNQIQLTPGTPQMFYQLQLP